VSVDLEGIRAAARAIAGGIVATPCHRSRTLSALCDAEVWVKFENLQFTASFKERGALNRLLALSPEERRRGVVAMSAGNHAQGVAYHAGRLGIPAKIVMPSFTPFVKVRHTRDFGAEVILFGETLEIAAARAQAIATEEDRTFVHPYDDDLVIAGQGTIGLELHAAASELDTAVVPVGGGGLIAGVATALKALNPRIRIVAVEAALYPSLKAALEGGSPVVGGATVAEGIAVKAIGARPLAIARALVDEILTVDEAQLERAIQLYLEVEKTVAEGAGAAPLAALLAHPDLFRGRKVGLVLSGGNIDSRLLASVIMRGLVRDGRLLRIRVEIADSPGLLARVAAAVGDKGGNIVDVAHQRLFSDVPIKSADLDLVIETRDPAHGEEIIAALAALGFAVRRLATTAAGP